MAHGSEKEALERRAREASIQSSIPCPFTQSVAYENHDHLQPVSWGYRPVPHGITPTRHDDPNPHPPLPPGASHPSTNAAVTKKRSGASPAMVGGAVVLGGAMAAGIAFGSIAATSSNVSIGDLGSIFGSMNLSGLGSFDMGSLGNISMPQMPGMPGMPDIGSIGMPGLPDLNMPSMPDINMPSMPDINMPGMPDLGGINLDMPNPQQCCCCDVGFFQDLFGNTSCIQGACGCNPMALIGDNCGPCVSMGYQVLGPISNCDCGSVLGSCSGLVSQAGDCVGGLASCVGGMDIGGCLGSITGVLSSCADNVGPAAEGICQVLSVVLSCFGGD